MTDRFFCAELNSKTPILTGMEAHHAIHVLRLKPGQSIEIFDGAGTVAEALVEDLQRDRVVTRTVTTSFHKKPTQHALTVAAVPPKGDRLKWMVEKLTELGVDTYVPLQTERSVVDPRKSKLDRLAATVTAAMKQCGRRWRMEIAVPQSLKSLLLQCGNSGDTILLAHPGDTPEPAEAEVGRRTLLIGPEGGFTDSEVQLAASYNVRQIAWPDSILRIETAAIAFTVRLLR
ncbi:MAG: 16S rRNA (uracil(1498)-N(3))-methyltransferase [Fuerstiella sp.]|nr:16S rRNA (uracil(1498)-N(3))-methyltransferase [Fuerstiella sp.]MCP4509190.1 16S rRNA (uracil(1498)-N(3))-methyltransferase [Fuerstiella sp.]